MGRLIMEEVGGDLMCSFPCRKINAVYFPYLVVELIRDFKKGLNNEL
jgi:hypothetical protein